MPCSRGGVLSQHALQQGGPGGLLPGEGVCSRGGCLVETPLMATAAGGTHPTGVHSCL